MRRAAMVAPLAGISVLAISVWFLSGLNFVKVNGPCYQRIAQAKDLVADVVSPRSQLVEANLNAFQIVGETDDASLKVLLATARRLRADYEAHATFWRRVLPTGDGNAALLERAYAPGAAFLSLRDRQLIPMVVRGDRAGAARLLRNELQARYQEHLTAIRAVAAAATQETTQLESEAVAVIGRRRAAALSAIGLLAAVIAGLVVGPRSVRTPWNRVVRS